MPSTACPLLALACPCSFLDDTWSGSGAGDLDGSEKADTGLETQVLPCTFVSNRRILPTRVHANEVKCLEILTPENLVLQRSSQMCVGGWGGVNQR